MEIENWRTYLRETENQRYLKNWIQNHLPTVVDQEDTDYNLFQTDLNNQLRIYCNGYHSLIYFQVTEDIGNKTLEIKLKLGFSK